MVDKPLQVLSAVPLSTERYGPELAELLQPRRLVLGVGRAEASARRHLERLEPGETWFGRRVVDREMAQACWGGLWLYFDFLDESHRVSQSLASATGSYWHAIMHRREGDFENAKYWFRHAGRHPVETGLAEAGRVWNVSFGQVALAAGLTDGSPWQPARFVDWVAAVERGRSPGGEACEALQLVEWWALFDFGWQRAMA